MTNDQHFEPLYNLKHASTHVPNRTNQRRSEVLEGVAWNYSKVVLPTMSQLASHHGFHDLKTWLTWWQSIGLVKLYSSEDKWVPNCPVNPDDSRFCSTLPSTWREVALSSPSPPRWCVHRWTTCAAVAQISRHSQKIAMAWRDACENNNIYMIIYSCKSAPFLMHLRIILLWSFMLIAGWMRETHHLKYSYESDIIWLWNIETWKKRTVAYKNETPRHNSWAPNSTQSAHRWSPVIQKLDCDTLGRLAFECNWFATLVTVPQGAIPVGDQGDLNLRR